MQYALRDSDVRAEVLAVKPAVRMLLGVCVCVCVHARRCKDNINTIIQLLVLRM